MVDVCNHSLTYSLCGMQNHMSPDDHFADLKRIISAAAGKARRINVIMPFLYESRVETRKGRESLDCAMALHELCDMGVDNIITFDAHDPRVMNAIPLNGFETVAPTYQFIKALLEVEPDLRVDSDHMMIISPDAHGMKRAIYYANLLGIDLGMFYKRRDYTRSIDGRNPIVAHEFLGADVAGKTCVVIDDMISSGESAQDVARELKRMKAARVIICATFGFRVPVAGSSEQALLHERRHEQVYCPHYRQPEPRLLHQRSAEPERAHQQGREASHGRDQRPQLRHGQSRETAGRNAAPGPE